MLWQSGFVALLVIAFGISGVTSTRVAKQTATRTFESSPSRNLNHQLEHVSGLDNEDVIITPWSTIARWRPYNSTLSEIHGKQIDWRSAAHRNKTNHKERLQLVRHRCSLHAATPIQKIWATPLRWMADLRMAAEDFGLKSDTQQVSLYSDRTPSVKVVRVRWHVIRSGVSYTEGSLSSLQIVKQIDLLNQHFARAYLRFLLTSVDYTTNPIWFRSVANGAVDQAMKLELHKGSRQHYNVYSCAPVGVAGYPVAGYTSMPESIPKQYQYKDGSVILFTTLPGGSQFGLDLGMTLVHEAGHWLSLYHTFQGGCTSPGDLIEDTPFEASPSYDCIPKDTCPQPGVDPIHNPMNYSPDSCMTEFTQDQVRAIRRSWFAFRE